MNQRNWAERNTAKRNKALEGSKKEGEKERKKEPERTAVNWRETWNLRLETRQMGDGRGGTPGRKLSLDDRKLSTHNTEKQTH